MADGTPRTPIIAEDAADRLYIIDARNGVERQLLLDLTGTAPIAHLCHALAQLGCGLCRGQNIPAVHRRLTGHHRVDPKLLYVSAYSLDLLAHGR